MSKGKKEWYSYTDKDIALTLGVSTGAVRVAKSRGEFKSSDFESVFDYMFRKVLFRVAASKNKTRRRNRLCPRFY